MAGLKPNQPSSKPDDAPSAESGFDTFGDGPPPRKLAHLTPAERAARRQAANKLSAVRSRNRRRAVVERLPQVIAENERLALANTISEQRIAELQAQVAAMSSALESLSATVHRQESLWNIPEPARFLESDAAVAAVFGEARFASVEADVRRLQRSQLVLQQHQAQTAQALARSQLVLQGRQHTS